MWISMLNNSKKGPVASWLYEEITALQYGEKPDPYGWIEKL
jgi:branched-chain amino acid aminotransferase